VGLSADNDPDFTDAFCGFLQRCVANVDAAELLLALARNPERSWTIDELLARLAPDTNIGDADAERRLDSLQQCGVVARETDKRFRYAPLPAHDAHVALLARLYLERPVTLFRVIYALRDSKINTFADAFKLRG
jgi:DNA-binding MarR family transcriptional regulator